MAQAIKGARPTVDLTKKPERVVFYKADAAADPPNALRVHVQIQDSEGNQAPSVDPVTRESVTDFVVDDSCALVVASDDVGQPLTVLVKRYLVDVVNAAKANALEDV